MPSRTVAASVWNDSSVSATTGFLDRRVGGAKFRRQHREGDKHQIPDHFSSAEKMKFAAQKSTPHRCIHAGSGPV
jgi:hypothetical protein